jgi:hypothetical protein
MSQSGMVGGRLLFFFRVRGIEDWGVWGVWRGVKGCRGDGMGDGVFITVALSRLSSVR